MQAISRAVRRSDFNEKVEGAIRYCADIKREHMCHALTLRSEKARAWIRTVSIPPMPDGYFIVGRNDVPGSNIVPVVYDDQPFFAEDTVNFIGEPILLVVGPDKSVIQSIMDGIAIEYEDIEPVFSIEEAESRQQDHVGGREPFFADYSFEKGNLDGVIEDAAFCIEEEYRCGYQEQAYLETQSMLGEYENGRIVVSGSMQCPYYIKTALIRAIGCSEDGVRVVQLPTGGGFGGKEEFPSIIGVHAGLAALKTKGSVQIIYDRKEDIGCTTKRHPAIIRIKSYIGKDNRIIGHNIDVKTDAGAYSGLSGVVLQRLIFSAAGAYNIPNLKVHGRAYATNNVPTGAFRGFGGAQAIWAIEMHMDKIARQIGMDPMVFKQNHFYHRGDRSATGGVFNFQIRLDDIIEKIQRMSDYRQKWQEYESRANAYPDRKMKGIGCSVFYHGCGFTGAGEHTILRPKIRLRKKSDGRVEILASITEIGQGSFTAMRKIVSEALKIPIDDVIYDFPDTDVCPDSGPTVASRSTMIVGKLLKDAALIMKDRWGEDSFDIDLEYQYPDFLKWDNDKFEGNAYPEYSWGANVAEVEIDPDTLELAVTGFWAVYDIGTPIDEKMARGQIEGGIVQSLGYACMEVMELRKGKILQGNLTDYVIPTAGDFPDIESDLIENPFPEGPFGARGLGELSFVGAAPALTLAVRQAVGRSLLRIPVTPEYLLEVMANYGQD